MALGKGCSRVEVARPGRVLLPLTLARSEARHCLGLRYTLAEAAGTRGGCWRARRGAGGAGVVPETGNSHCITPGLCDRALRALETLQQNLPARLAGSPSVARPGSPEALRTRSCMTALLIQTVQRPALLHRPRTTAPPNASASCSPLSRVSSRPTRGARQEAAAMAATANGGSGAPAPAPAGPPSAYEPFLEVALSAAKEAGAVIAAAWNQPKQVDTKSGGSPLGVE